MRSLMRRAARSVLLLWASAMGLVLVLLAWPQGAHAQGIPPEAHRYQRTLQAEAQLAWGLGAPVAVFAAQVHQESRWRPSARSPVGALGMAQFMPATAKWLGGLRPDLANPQPTNPTWALRAMVGYNRWLWQRIPVAANACQRMAYVLASYNGGLGWVLKRQTLSSDPGTCMGAAGTCAINPGVSPAAQRENAHYPVAILLQHQPLYAQWGPALCLDNANG